MISLSSRWHSGLYGLLLFLTLAVGTVAQIPVTDNAGPPYLGVFHTSLGSQDGIRGDNHFAWWLNRTSIYATTGNGDHNATWAMIDGNSSYVPGWKRWAATNPGAKIVLMVQMLPGYQGTPDAGNSHAKGARGDYDVYYRNLSIMIRDAGLSNRTIIRLGWEFNGSWYPWRVQNGSAEHGPIHFAAYFCRISKTMREVPATAAGNPADLRFNWCGARRSTSWDVATAYPGNVAGGTTSSGVTWPAYPGDDYVHSVGVDIYDTDNHQTSYGDPANTMPWSGTVLSRAWNNIVGSATSNWNGIAKWQKIANDHGKPMSFPEWGLSTTPETSGNPAGGFDNPYFIEKMHQYIHNPVNNILFQAYFDTASASNHRISQLPGEEPTANPNAALKFRQLFTPPLPNRHNIGTISAVTRADGLNVVGAGAGIAGNADNFYFTSRVAETDDMMMVKVTSMSVAAGQGGLMLRQYASANAGSPYSALLIDNNRITAQVRSVASGPTTQTIISTGVTFPVWLKLVRRGSTVFLLRSSDGLNWVFAAKHTLTALSATAALGICVGSGSESTLNILGVDKLDSPDLKLEESGLISSKVIKDNGDAGVSYTPATAWAVEALRTDRYGADYRIAVPSAGAARVTYAPGLTASGLYEVYMQWPSRPEYAYDVPITINHVGGSHALTGNQEAGTARWIYAGTFSLDSASSVVINNSTTSAGVGTVADSVMFVPVPVPSNEPINFNNYTLTGYSGQDGSGTAVVEDGGSTLRLTGNSWKRIDFPYTPTPNTVIELDFRSTVEGEVHAIGLDGNNSYDGNLVQLYGYDVLGKQTFNNYSGTGWVHYTIPVGNLVGQQLYLFFINDKDTSPFTNTSYFRNVTVHE